MQGATILLLAAGASARMGGADKLMLPVGGVPLLARSAQRAAATGAPVIVALPPQAPARRRALEGLGLTLLDVPDAAEGMAASIRAGVAAAGAAAGLALLPADMPDLTTEDLARLLAAFGRAPDAVHRATAADGRPGHPVIFPRRLFPALARLAGDTGGRALLRDEAVRATALPGEHALTDLDTPEDWAAWRARHAL